MVKVGGGGGGLHEVAVPTHMLSSTSNHNFSRPGTMTVWLKGLGGDGHDLGEFLEAQTLRAESRLLNLLCAS